MLIQPDPGGLVGHHDVVDVLLGQHARVRELITQVTSGRGEHRRSSFDALRVELAVHEAGEESVVHPVTRRSGAVAVADARVGEEQHASQAITQLESMDLDGPEFEQAFAVFARAVSEHADKEEQQEFPTLRSAVMEQQLQAMAARLVSGQNDALARLNPHPEGPDAATRAPESFAAMLEDATQAMRSA